MALASERVEERYEAQAVPFGKLLGVGMEPRAATDLGFLLMLASIVVVALVALGVVPG